MFVGDNFCVSLGGRSEQTYPELLVPRISPSFPQKFPGVFAGTVDCEFFLGVQKLHPVRFKRGIEEGLLKDEFAFFEACKSPKPERRKLHAKCPYL